MGDLNSRCGIAADFIESDIIDKTSQNHILSVRSYIPDEETTKCKTEENNTINSHGRALISFHQENGPSVTQEGTSLIEYVLKMLSNEVKHVTFVLVTLICILTTSIFLTVKNKRKQQ